MTERQPIRREAPPAQASLEPRTPIDPKLDAALQTLEMGYELLKTEEGFRRYLTIAARFHTYSLRNNLMIMVQDPEATRVAGFHTWKKLGRWVMKRPDDVPPGEWGIKIWRPITVKDPTGEINPETGKVREIVTGFTTATVFDVRRTDGEPLPEPPMPKVLEGSGAYASRLYDGLKVYAESQGATVKRERIKGDAHGYYRPSTKEIAISHRIYGEQAMKTMAHETAHMLTDYAGIVTRADAEHVGEGSAFCFCHYHGFDTGQYTFPYLVNWSADSEVFRRNIGETHRVARKMISGVDKVLDEVVVFDRLPSKDELLPNRGLGGTMPQY
jgi:hypothetical protein